MLEPLIIGGSTELINTEVPTLGDSLSWDTNQCVCDITTVRLGITHSSWRSTSTGKAWIVQNVVFTVLHKILIHRWRKFVILRGKVRRSRTTRGKSASRVHIYAGFRQSRTSNCCQRASQPRAPFTTTQFTVAKLWSENLRQVLCKIGELWELWLFDCFIVSVIQDKNAIHSEKSRTSWHTFWRNTSHTQGQLVCSTPVPLWAAPRRARFDQSIGPRSSWFHCFHDVCRSWSASPESMSE